MTRLFQAIAGAHHGGAEAFFTRLAVALERAGQEQRVAIRYDTDRSATLRAGGVDVTELSFGGRLDFLTRPRLKKLLKSWQPRVTLSWMNRATALMPRGAYVRVARLGGYYDLKYYRGCDHLVGNTRDIVEHLVRNGWPAERAHYLPNFVDASAARPALRAPFATPTDAPLLLALGRLHQNKGFDVLLHAMVQVPGAYLWLAGEGPERAALEQLIQRLDLGSRVRLLGWRDDSATLMATADVVVCSSRHEPLGNVVIEAWARGVPVVSTASEGPRALIRSGENGLLVPTDDSDELARAIRDMLAGDRAAFEEAGRAAYEQEFTETAVVAAYREFFDRVAA